MTIGRLHLACQALGLLGFLPQVAEARAWSFALALLDGLGFEASTHGRARPLKDLALLESSDQSSEAMFLAAVLAVVPVLLATGAFCLVEKMKWRDSSCGAPTAAQATSHARRQRAGTSARFTAEFGSDHSQRNSIAQGVMAAAACERPSITDPASCKALPGAGPRGSVADRIRASAQAAVSAAAADETQDSQSIPAPRQALYPSIIGGADDRTLALASPLETPLLVKSPGGILVYAEGELCPHPEQRTVNILRARDQHVILQARVDERQNLSRIIIESCTADPLAVLETNLAVSQEASCRRPPGQRRVVIRSPPDGQEELGMPCAWVVPGSPGKFLVYFLPGDGEPSLTASVRAGSSMIDVLFDSHGAVLARSHDVETTRGPDGYHVCTSPLWVKQSVDMVLVVCVALSIQKLGVKAPHSSRSSSNSWTSDLLVPGPARSTVSIR